MWPRIDSTSLRRNSHIKDSSMQAHYRQRKENLKFMTANLSYNIGTSENNIEEKIIPSLGT